MKRFQHLYVYLTLRDDDAAVLRWTSLIAGLADTTRVTLLHVWPPVEIPDVLKKQYPWLVAPGDDVARTRLDELVSQHLQLPEGTALETKVRQGNPLGELLAELSVQQPDLIIINRDTADFALAEKLARKAPCSVLGVPSSAPVKFKHVLAAFDFSDFSRHALDVAAAFASSSAARLSVLHAFEVPWGHQRALVSREQLADEMKTYLGAELARETAPLASRVAALDQHVVEAHLPSTAISRIVDEEKCDFVVIGCRGHGAIYATLLGSTAESILQKTAVPVLAVKQKGSSLSLLEQLRQAAH